MSQYSSEKEEFWSESVSVWKKSGLSARQFCRKEDLGYQSFLSWKRRLLQNSDCFIELEAEVKELSSLELSCGEISLSIPINLNSQELSHLILALHKASQKC